MSNEEPHNECIVATKKEAESLGLARPVGFTLVAGARQQPSLGKASDMIYMWLPTPPSNNYVAIHIRLGDVLCATDEAKWIENRTIKNPYHMVEKILNYYKDNDVSIISDYILFCKHAVL